MTISLMNVTVKKMSDSESKLLQKILSEMEDGFESFTVSDEEYQAWKIHFEQKSEHDKVFNLLGVLSQYLLGGGRAGASVLASAVICTSRWCNEKDNEEWLKSL